METILYTVNIQINLLHAYILFLTYTLLVSLHIVEVTIDRIILKCFLFFRSIDVVYTQHLQWWCLVKRTVSVDIETSNSRVVLFKTRFRRITAKICAYKRLFWYEQKWNKQNKLKFF